MPPIFNPFIAQRKQHKLQLLGMIDQLKGRSVEQIIALFSLKTGLKRSTIREYWHELEDAGVIENGKRLVDPIKSERSREAIKQINERRAGADTTSEGDRASYKKQKIKATRKKDLTNRPKTSKADNRTMGSGHGKKTTRETKRVRKIVARARKATKQRSNRKKT